MWAKTKQMAATTFGVLKSAAEGYGQDRANRMSAAVAYRTMFALAPLLLIAVYFLSLVVGDSTQAEETILDAIERLAGEAVSEAVDTFLDSVVTTGGTAGVVGFALLLWTGSSLFLELQNDLNDIFGVPYEHVTGIVATVIKRLIGFAWALGVGLILIGVWFLNSVWRYIETWFPDDFAAVHRAISAVAPLASVLLLPFVFALVFKTLSRAQVRWRAVWAGSLFTSVAFIAAAYGTGVYFAISEDNVAAIAGALFIILLLAFVLAAVFLFGAEVTKAYAEYLDNGEQEEVTTAGEPQALVAQAPPATPVAAIGAFLAGMLVGWWRRK